MNAQIEIRGKKYNLPLDYSQITLGKFKEIQKFIDLNTVVSPFLLGDTKKQPSEEELINYYIKFINVVTDVPIPDLMNVRQYSNEEETGIDNIFKSLTYLFTMPKDSGKPVERIKDYYFIDNSGIMANNKFIEFTEASTVSSKMHELQHKKVMDELKLGRMGYLNMLMAIFYRPKKRKWFKKHIEGYNSLTVTERAKDFDDVPMNVVWDAMFFFIQSKKELLKNIEGYSGEKLEKALIDLKGIIGT
jgi:hypothetical protein